MEIFNLVKPHSPGQASMKSSASSAEISCELVQKKKKKRRFIFILKIMTYVNSVCVCGKRQ